MADPSTYRPAVGSIPESPGVYKFRDPSGRVIYVGKAKSLRQRLNSYFADVAGLHPRTCSNGVFKRAGQIGRPCLLGYIGKCAAPCVGRVSAEEHREIVDDFCDFMAGKTESMIKRLEREMAAAAEAMEYEKAARLRDDLGALKRALEKQAVVLGDGTDADVVAFAQDELEAAVQVFHVRGGRVRSEERRVGKKCRSRWSPY